MRAGPACDIRRWRLPAEDSTFPHVNALLAVLCCWKQLRIKASPLGPHPPDPGPTPANAPVLSHAMCNHGSRGNSCNTAALSTSMVHTERSHDVFYLHYSRKQNSKFGATAALGDPTGGAGTFMELKVARPGIKNLRNLKDNGSAPPPPLTSSALFMRCSGNATTQISR